jgi:hypothetical protein
LLSVLLLLLLLSSRRHGRLHTLVIVIVVLLRAVLVALLELEPLLEREVKVLELGAQDGGVSFGADGQLELGDACAGAPFVYFLEVKQGINI